MHLQSVWLEQQGAEGKLLRCRSGRVGHVGVSELLLVVNLRAKHGGSRSGRFGLPPRPRLQGQPGSLLYAWGRSLCLRRGFRSGRR